MRTVVLILCLLAALPRPAPAHDLGLAQVELRAGAGATIRMRAKLSATIDAQAPGLPAGCSAIPGRAGPAPGGNQLVGWTLTCQPGVPLSFMMLPWPLQAAMVTEIAADGQAAGRLVSAGPDGIRVGLDRMAGAGRSAWAISADYTRLGIDHILIGLDHIALLLCLALLASGWTLVRLATAFTIGHSVTLGLAALDVVRVPQAPMEAVIALSVVYLARDVVLGRRFGPRHVWLLAGIGLVHGLGFASVLGEIGLPASARLSALLCFNLGVEIGQILVLAVAALTGTLFVRTLRLRPRSGVSLLGWATGILAAFWTLERIAFYA